MSLRTLFLLTALVGAYSAGYGVAWRQTQATFREHESLRAEREAIQIKLRQAQATSTLVQAEKAQAEQTVQRLLEMNSELPDVK